MDKLNRLVQFLVHIPLVKRNQSTLHKLEWLIRKRLKKNATFCQEMKLYWIFYWRILSFIYLNVSIRTSMINKTLIRIRKTFSILNTLVLCNRFKVKSGFFFSSSKHQIRDLNDFNLIFICFCALKMTLKIIKNEPKIVCLMIAISCNL